MVGASFAIGGINPLLKSPKSDIWSMTLERKLGSNFAASVGYNGSHSYNIVGNGNSIGNVSYGVDINSFPGDLITRRTRARPQSFPAHPAQSELRSRLPMPTTIAMATTTP